MVKKYDAASPPDEQCSSLQRRRLRRLHLIRLDGFAVNPPSPQGEGFDDALRGEGDSSSALRGSSE